VHDREPGGRVLRLLAADLVFALPVVADLARRGGATLACVDDAERLFAEGELVGVFPEGFKGIGKLYRDRYRLQRFGRGGFVSVALRSGIPIVPCAVVGAEEAHPMLADLHGVAQRLGLPYLPVTPTFPWLGPLGFIPFPGRWTIRFAPPIVTAGLSPTADPRLVVELTEQVRTTIAEMIRDIRAA
jgi:1-acyl-sn-glycerol-3-phosphate acyltransferase